MANFFDTSVKISRLASIEVSAKGTNTFIDAYSVIDDFVKIKHVGGDGNIRIGKYVYINSGTVMYSGNGITIGNEVLMGPNCSIVPVNHEFSSLDIPIRLQGFSKSKGGIIIEDNVWIGAGVTILDGSVIKSGCIIAANSLVIGVTEPNAVYSGSPIKFIRWR
jgi:acetyltransferase-like isoleucine patch superfamily enzyme